MNDILSNLPLAWIPWITAAVTIASLIVAHVPQPKGPTWAFLWSVLNLIAHNVHLAAPPTQLPNPLSMGKQAGFAHRYALLFLVGFGLLCALCACTTSPTGQAALTPAAQTVVSVLCAADTLAPVAIAAGTQIATISGANATTVAQINQSAQLTHPLVQAACAAALPGSMPAKVTTTTVPASN